MSWTSTETPIVEKKILIQPLEYSDAGRILLYNFFDYMSKNRKTVHVLHFGDSQIEGDRITAYLRYKMQKK